MSKVLQIEYIETEKLIPYVNNSRTHSDEQVTQICASIKEFGFTNPILIDESEGIIAGHGRVSAAKRLGMVQVPCIRLIGLTKAQRKAYVIADNQLALNAGWDFEKLKLEIEDLQDIGFDIDLLGFDDDFFSLFENNDIDETNDISGSSGNKSSLSDRFLIPPFSTLNSREGWWQNRKRSWISLGINSGLGRNSGFQKGMNNLIKKLAGNSAMTENDDSIFDPVLCELLYSWFSSKGGQILDPFAGGSVRGIVAGKLGRKYLGVDLRQEQIDENRKQANVIIQDCDDMPMWVCGDSLNIDRLAKGIEADFLISCPPYADLEVYSDNPSDLSNMPYKDFKAAYFEIIRKSCVLLKNNRFACFVVGEVRDKKGNYYNFVGDTIKAFIDAGLNYYNEAVLINACGSLAFRAAKPFTNSRKLGKCHQNVLIFVKGDAKIATQYCGDVDIHIPDNEETKTDISS